MGKCRKLPASLFQTSRNSDGHLIWGRDERFGENCFENTMRNRSDRPYGLERTKMYSSGCSVANTEITTTLQSGACVSNQKWSTSRELASLNPQRWSKVRDATV